MPTAAPLRITICPIEYHNNYGELARFEVDAATTTLREVAERVGADPLVYCKTARIGLTLSPYEDDVTGDPIDLSDPAIALEPLSAVAAHLLPRSAERACGGPVAFVDGQELWLVVGGCATEAAALEFIGGALLKAQFDCAALSKEAAALRSRNAALEEEVATVKKEAASQAAELQSLRLAVGPLMHRETLFQQQEEAAAREALADEEATLLTAIALQEAAERERAHQCGEEARKAKWKAESLISSNRGNVNEALKYACKEGMTREAVRLVRHHGADVQHTYFWKWTPLHNAVQSGHTNTAVALVKELGADVSARDEGGSSPLHTAASVGRADTVRALVTELGADVGARSNDGCTPLHNAAANGRTDTVRVFVKELGADVNARDNSDQTPLHLAAHFGHTETARILVKELGADPNLKNKNGKAPLDIVDPSRRAAFGLFIK